MQQQELVWSLSLPDKRKIDEPVDDYNDDVAYCQHEWCYL